MSSRFSLVFQGFAPTDIAELRGFLGLSYRNVLAALGAKNQILLRNTQHIAPVQAAEMQARWRAPETPPARPPRCSRQL